ncbi:hypothetical protein MCHK_1436 [Mesorhizobium huakuii 7653R]|nr:hypothetical protein MCHK_1436 [Mesorhizobium huakuii 7653R]
MPVVPFNTLFADGPVGNPYQPTKQDLRDTFNDLSSRVDNAIATQGSGGISKLAVDMWNGSAVSIECFGDSTQLGVDPLVLSSPYLAALPAPQKLQLFLRDYYSNNNITVTNRAVSGTLSTQMLDGTDGSGSTFAAKMAVSSAQVVYCNHGINDCQNGTPTPPLTYRSNLLQFVNICRANGKIPILQTPNPIFAVPTLGTADKANRLKNYVQIMKDVAAETGTVLVDINTVVYSLIRSGDYRVLDVVPDGVHPTNIVYRLIGQMMAMPFVYPQPGLSMANQFMSCVEGTVNITPANTPLIAEATRTGFQQISDAINQPKSLRVLVKVDEPGLDIWIGYPIWSGGLTSVGVGFDQGVTVGSINQQSAISLTGSEFVQDHEVCVARNVPVGLHMVTLSSSAGAAALGLSYVRTRRSSVKKSFGRTTVTGFDRHKDLLGGQSVTIFANGADAVELWDELPISRLIATEGIGITFAATFAKDTQFVLHGVNTAPPTGATGMKARMGVGVGCAASTGFVTVYQLTGENTYTATAVNAADFSGVSKQYRLVIDPGSSSLKVYNGPLLGTVALTTPYLGGFMGLRSNVSGSSPIISDLRSIEH